MQHKPKSYYAHHEPNGDVDPEWVRIQVVNEAIGPDVGYAQVVARVGSEEFTFEGTSRRNNVDPPNDEIGALLAHGRAYKKLSKHLLKKAEGLSKHYEDCRETRKQRLAAEQAAEAEKKKKKKPKTKKETRK